MGIKSIFMGCEESVFIDAASLLAKNQGWEIAYWCAMTSSQPRIAKRFPGVILHDTLEAVRGLPAPALARLQPNPPDAPLLDELAPKEAIALQMMDRIGAGATFTLTERRDHYHRLIGYWQAVLDHLDPQVAVFPTAPHMVFDYIVYLLCRQRGIATALFEFVPPIPRLLFIQESFEQGIDGLDQMYRAKLDAYNGGEVVLSSSLEKALAKVQASYDQGAPWYMKTHSQKASHYLAARSWKSRGSQLLVPSKAIETIHRTRRFLLAPPPLNYTKLRGWRLQQEQPSGLLWRLDRIRRNWLTRRANRYYNLKARHVDLTRPYILAALHFQPERTTSPLGGRYADQLLMLRLISRWLPKNWCLYVKEAPAFFYPHVVKQPTRSPEYYDEIKALPNTELVTMDYDIYEMVDKSMAVATVTGTVGWEAVLRGKPSLIFGHPWYSLCEGVHRCGNEASLRRAIKTVAEGEKPQIDKVRLFMQSLEELSLGAFIDGRFREMMDVSDHDNHIRLAQALHNLVNRQLEKRP